jgi:superfamily II DNA helicase RecQ
MYHCNSFGLTSLCLEKDEVEMVAVIPNRPNIFINLSTTPAMQYELKWYIDELCEKGISARKCIDYAYSLHDVATYEHIMVRLGSSAWIPDKPQTTEHRLVGMYHGSVGSQMEKTVVDHFTKVGSNIRVIVCTIAFGMGINIPDVEVVIHWGANTSILSYWQDIGRCARDGRN